MSRLGKWMSPRELRNLGIVGINRRNADYVLMHNPRALYPRVDDKVQTKNICRECNIPVPGTYAIIERFGDIKRFPEQVGDAKDFVIKPASGSGGRGIVVIVDHDGKNFTGPGGKIIPLADLQYHLSTVLSGLFSLGGQPDCAIIEQRIIRHPDLDKIAVGGTPDIRIILFRGVPVMAMMRLPTSGSGGRANLHQGAIAAAIDLVTGRTSGGVSKNRVITVHPDTGHSIEGFEIPDWNSVLNGAMRLGDGIGMGYLGVDFAIDATQGPLVLEANARPGLTIQVANRTGLLRRLQFVETLSKEDLKPERRLELIPRISSIY
ncbi:MAG: alpha-L-glutamate ligase-like protein [Verrucomicrobiales bacterium]|nr:alpha-L-glutamate ligase-like protein [Verrucomicrobiales bacterium]